MTIKIDVRDETGDRYTALVEHVYDILTRSVPTMERETELTLPDVTYRLLDPNDWAVSMGTYMRGALQRDTAGHDLASKDARRIQLIPNITINQILKSWALIAPDTITDSLLRPEIILAPDSLVHQGVLDVPGALHEELIRPLAHLAQINASKGTVIPAKVWPIKNYWPGHPVRLLSLGHARWASRIVTPCVLGKAVGKMQLKRSHEYRRQASRLMIRYGILVDKRCSRRATRFVDRAIAECGLSRFNEIWTGPALVPSSREISHPSKWLSRI